MKPRFIINEYRRFAEWLSTASNLSPHEAKRELFGAELFAARLVRNLLPRKPFEDDSPETLRFVNELKQITELVADSIDK